MPTNSNNIFGPPSSNELQGDLFGPPTGSVTQPPIPQEQGELFAPPSSHELVNEVVFAPPQAKELNDIPDSLADSDYQAIAQKHGVSVQDLKEIAPYYGVNSDLKSPGEALSQGAKYTTGFIGRSAGLGIPQLLYKKTQSGPMRNAIDDLNEIASSQRSGLESVNELVMPSVGIPNVLHKGGKLIQGVTRAAEGFGLAGLVGATSAREGHELEGAKDAITSPYTIGLVTGASVLPHVLAKKGGSKAEIDALMAEQPKNMQFDITEEIGKQAGKSTESDALIGKYITKGELPKDYTEAEKIVREQMPREDLAKLLNTGTDEGIAVAHRAIVNHPEFASEMGTNRAIILEAARDIVERKAMDFAENELKLSRPKSFAEANEAISNYSSRQGPEYLSTKYTDFVNMSAAEKAIQEQGLRAIPETGLDKIQNKISGAQFVLRNIDDKFGTGTERALQLLSKGSNKLTFPRATFRKRLDEVYQIAKKSGIDREIRDSDTILKAIEGNQVHLLQPAQKEVADKVNSYFQSVRNFANKTATRLDPLVQRLGIPKLENYVTRVAMETSDLIPRVERSLELAEASAQKVYNKKLNQLNSREVTELAASNPEVNNLVEFMNWKNSAKTIPQSGGALMGQVRDGLYAEGAIPRMEKAARATMERTGELPDFIREKNLYKIMDRYTKDVLDTLYKRRGLDALRLEMRKLQTAGAEAPAKYIENIITDTLGSRKGTAARVFSSIKTDIARTLNHRIEKATGSKKVALETAKELIHLPGYISRQIYGNVLGWGAIRPIVQNLVSGIARTAPELGNRYGSYTYLRGLIGAIGDYRKTGKLVKKQGLVPDEFIRAGERALSDGLRSSGLVTKSNDALEGMSKLLMATYRASEDLNRAAILKTAQVMSDDLARGSGMAQKSLTKFPYAIRREIMGAKNQEQVTGILSDYLNSVTAFNYNKSSMFELGRDLGPLFSTFAKWPTEVMGEALYELRSKGLINGMGANAKRLLPVLAAFAGLDFALNKYADTADSDRFKKVFGAAGLKGAAPINSLGGFVKGEIFTPPAINAIMKGVVNPMLSGDGPSIEKGLSSVASQYMPGAGFIRFITDDIPTYITGTKPEGDTMIEKASDGIRKLSK